MLLRERLKTGDTDSQAIDYLVARYGEFILLKPRFNWHTWLLWLVPPGVLLVGGLVAGAAAIGNGGSGRPSRRRSTRPKRPISSACSSEDG